jgi:hypothetical protein
MLGQTSGVIPHTKTRNKVHSMHVGQHFLLEGPPNNICRQSFKSWAFNLFMAKSRTRYCELFTAPRVQKLQ